MTRRAVIAAVTVMALGGIALAQDVNLGATLFKKCVPCHDVGPTARNKVGPNLNGLEGRKTGTVEGYSYSDANKNSGITWSEAEFLDYIKDPKAKIPNTKMVFAGIKNDADAKNLWAYLKQYGPAGTTK